MNIMKSLPLMLNSMAGRASCRVFMAKNTNHRKVLIVADEPSIKNLLLLVKKLDSRRVASSTVPCLNGIHRRSFDTAILDLRCSQGRPAARGYGFSEVWTSMTGRVLVVNAEVNNPKTLELAERYIYHRHTLSGLLYDLVDVIRSVVGHSPAPHHI